MNEGWMKVSVFCIFWLFFTGSHGRPDLGMVFQEGLGDGSFDVLVNGKKWLINGETYMTVDGKKYSIQEGSLKNSNLSQRAGYDDFGYYEELILFYTPVNSSSKCQFETRCRRYPNKNYVLLGQGFAGTCEGTSVGSADGLSSSYPSFSAVEKVDLGFLAYGGHMSGNTYKKIGRWNKDASKIKSGMDSGPLVLFDRSDATLIIAPFNHFMAVSAVYNTDKDGKTTGGWGFMGNTSKIPDGTASYTMLFFSERGINRAMHEWGSMMRTWYGKDDSYRQSDFTINYLGYWTDNGAYYYYLTESNKTYEQTILDVKAYSEQINVPYRYVQYDSWWYYKGPDDGVTEWTGMPNIFPDGLQYLFNQTGWPVLAHNRWWSSKTVYAIQNGGKYDFIVEPETKKALPQDAQFWDDLLRESKKWGLILYEQDWLNDQTDEMSATVSDIHVGRDWLRQMGNGAKKNGMTIQYCMALSRHILQSLEIPVVTQARASGDYQPGNDQWKIGITSIFTEAVGVAPYKDNFWTTTNQTGNKYSYGDIDNHPCARVSSDYQPGNDQWKVGISSIFAHALGLAPFKDDFWTTAKQSGDPYGRSEPFPALQSLVATLSTGPVGPSDKIGCSDAELIMKSVNAEGLILKPDRPARAIDDQIVMAAYRDFTGEVWTTHSVISGHMFGIILGADFSDDDMLAVTPFSAGFEHERPLPRSICFSHKEQDVEFSSQKPLILRACTKTDFCLHYITPVFNVSGEELVIYGEVEKWVPMSRQRVTMIETRGSLFGLENIKLYLKGAVGETTNFYMRLGKEMLKFECTFHDSGTTILDLAARKCLFE